MQDRELHEVLSEIALWPVDSELATSPTEIKGGLTNRSFLLNIGQSKYRLRLNTKLADSLGIDRQREEQIVHQIHAAGLGPKLLFSGKNYRYSLFEYVEGRAWSAEDFQDKKQRRRMDDHIRAFQRLSIDGPPRDYRAYLNHYWQQLRDTDQLSEGERQKYLSFDALLEKQIDQSESYVLCHHDLIPENIIETEKGLSIIDWEYAALGHPDLDSYCTNNFDVDTKTQIFKDEDTVGQLVFWLNGLWTLVSEKLRQPC